MQDITSELWLQTHIALQSFAGKPFVGAYTHNLKTTGHIWTTFSKSNNCSTIKDISCVVGLYWKPDWEAKAPDAHQLFYDTTYIPIWCLTTHDNKAHIAYDSILHTKWWLYDQRCIGLLRVKNYLQNITTSRDGLAKVHKQGRDKNTRKQLLCYRKIVVKKTRRLLYICCIVTQQM